MMHYFSLFLMFLFASTVSCQTIPQADVLLLDPDAILQKEDSIPQVLLVGSSHFAYYGADAHVTEEENQVNYLSPERQKEMRELVQYIAQFKPTKIAVELNSNSSYHQKFVDQFKAYANENAELKVNEINQIAFRLMKQFQLDSLYGVNAYGVVRDLSKVGDTVVLDPILDSIYKDWDFRNDEEVSQRYNEWYEVEDQLALDHTILDYFKHMNAEKIIDRGWGAYLVGDFKNGSYEGADALAMHWYSRNLRIFRNIQNITEPNDRVLVLFGAGHMTILKYLFQCSPEFDLVRFGSLDAIQP